VPNFWTTSSMRVGAALSSGRLVKRAGDGLHIGIGRERRPGMTAQHTQRCISCNFSPF
jgi:hypothetical protein